MTTSNLPGANFVNASLALNAVSTWWPSKASSSLTVSQTNGSSSTTRIRFGEAAGSVMRFSLTECKHAGQRLSTLIVFRRAIDPTRQFAQTHRMANIFGQLFRIATWGESHGGGVGVVVDGVAAGAGSETGVVAGVVAGVAGVVAAVVAESMPSCVRFGGL